MASGFRPPGWRNPSAYGVPGAQGHATSSPFAASASDCTASEATPQANGFHDGDRHGHGMMELPATLPMMQPPGYDAAVAQVVRPDPSSPSVTQAIHRAARRASISLPRAQASMHPRNLNGSITSEHLRRAFSGRCSDPSRFKAYYIFHNGHAKQAQGPWRLVDIEALWANRQLTLRTQVAVIDVSVPDSWLGPDPAVLERIAVPLEEHLIDAQKGCTQQWTCSEIRTCVAADVIATVERSAYASAAVAAGHMQPPPPPSFAQDIAARQGGNGRRYSPSDMLLAQLSHHAGVGHNSNMGHNSNIAMPNPALDRTGSSDSGASALSSRMPSMTLGAPRQVAGVSPGHPMSRPAPMPKFNAHAAMFLPRGNGGPGAMSMPMVDPSGQAGYGVGSPQAQAVDDEVAQMLMGAMQRIQPFSAADLELIRQCRQAGW